MAVLVAHGGRERYKCSKCGKDIPKGMQHYREGSTPNFLRYHVDCVKAKKARGKRGKSIVFKVMMSTGYPTFVKAVDKGEAREQVKLAVANDTLEGSVVSVSEVTTDDIAKYPGILAKREKVVWNPKHRNPDLAFHKAKWQMRYVEYATAKKVWDRNKALNQMNEEEEAINVMVGANEAKRIIREIIAALPRLNPGAQYHALEFDKAHALHRKTGEAYDSGMADAHRESFRRSIGLHMPNPKRKTSRRSAKSFLPLVLVGGLAYLIYRNRA